MSHQICLVENNSSRGYPAVALTGKKLFMGTKEVKEQLSNE